ESHELLAFTVQLVKDVRGRVDDPHISLWIDPDGVCAARVASGRPVDRRVTRPVGSPVALRDAGNLALAEHRSIPGTDELAARFEFEQRVSPAMKHEHGPPGRHR